jgi:ABC-type sugar transport system ATPase subunit
MHDVFEVCDRATVMKNGSVVGMVHMEGRDGTRCCR